MRKLGNHAHIGAAFRTPKRAGDEGVFHINEVYYWALRDEWAKPYAYAVTFGNSGSEGKTEINDFINGSFNSSSFTLSLWYKRNSNAAVNTPRILNFFNSTQNTNSLRIWFDSNDDINIQAGKSSTDGNILNAKSSGGEFSDTTNWHHLYISVELGNTNERTVQLDNNTVSMTWTTYDTAEVFYFFNTNTWTIGNRFGQDMFFDGSITEFWFAANAFDSASFFHNNRGAAQWLGSKGEIPFNVRPWIYLTRHDSTDTITDWAADKGWFGDENKTLTNTGDVATTASRPPTIGL